MESAVQVHAEHEPPVGRRQLLEGRGVEDARVAHDRVDATEPVDGGANDRLSALGAGHGVVRCDRHAPCTLDLEGDLVGDARVCAVAAHGSAEVVDHHGRATPRDLDGVEATEAPTCSSDDDYLAGEVDHASSRD